MLPIADSPLLFFKKISEKGPLKLLVRLKLGVIPRLMDRLHLAF